MRTTYMDMILRSLSRLLACYFIATHGGQIKPITFTTTAMSRLITPSRCQGFLTEYMTRAD